MTTQTERFGQRMLFFHDLRPHDGKTYRQVEALGRVSSISRHCPLTGSRIMGAKSPIVPFVRPPKRPSDDVSDKPAGRATDFSDGESQRVLAAAARAVARELGRQAAREYFAELIGQSKVP
jgi:hypothetical protein